KRLNGLCECMWRPRPDHLKHLGRDVCLILLQGLRIISHRRAWLRVAKRVLHHLDIGTVRHHERCGRFPERVSPEPRHYSDFHICQRDLARQIEGADFVADFAKNRPIFCSESPTSIRPELLPQPFVHSPHSTSESPPHPASTSPLQPDRPAASRSSRWQLEP